MSDQPVYTNAQSPVIEQLAAEMLYRLSDDTTDTAAWASAKAYGHALCIAAAANWPTWFDEYGEEWEINRHHPFNHQVETLINSVMEHA